ncbi:Hypothetical predicted protein, partial [Xyrichtys novacula]
IQGCPSTHPSYQSTHLSFQVHTIIEHYHSVCLAALCQRPCAAQHPPLISLDPSTKDLEHRVLSPESMWTICASDRMGEPSRAAAYMQDVQGG